jgi:hypothetical protein
VAAQQTRARLPHFHHAQQPVQPPSHLFELAGPHTLQALLFALAVLLPQPPWLTATELASAAAWPRHVSHCPLLCSRTLVGMGGGGPQSLPRGSSAASQRSTRALCTNRQSHPPSLGAPRVDDTLNSSFPAASGRPLTGGAPHGGGIAVGVGKIAAPPVAEGGEEHGALQGHEGLRVQGDRAAGWAMAQLAHPG